MCAWVSVDRNKMFKTIHLCNEGIVWLEFELERLWRNYY